MKKMIWLLIVALYTSASYAQNNLKAIVKSEENKEPLIGVSIVFEGLKIAATTNTHGYVAFNNIPSGIQNITFSSVGYKTLTKTLEFPLINQDTISIILIPAGEELEDVVVSSTRSSGLVSNMATRMEVLNPEELEEKVNMKPGDIRMLLNETTGISTQQTSAITANASIRIQGLDGRYTQILKDGFPLYAGFSGGLSLLQTPPLDLQQVEIIKGSASTLYGGGAIAGLVNLISKTPKEERELDILINGTTAGGLDMNGFYAQKFNKIGLTVFASRNSSLAYDPSNIGFTAIPKFERYVFNPKLFVYFNDKTTLNFGLNTGFEDRIGGDISYIDDKPNNSEAYFERNKTNRISSQLAIVHQINEHEIITLKNSISYFDRDLKLQNYTFNGKQNSSFTEFVYDIKKNFSEWNMGLNIITDKFTEPAQQNVVQRDYDQNTFGAFLQNTIKPTDWITLETGLRGDYVSDYGFNLLPRISSLFKISPKFRSRIGGGFSYKAPTVFTEEAEQIQFQNVLPIDKKLTKTEKSVGGNLDITYRTGLFSNQVSFTVNQLFFYTYLSKPLQLMAGNFGKFNFVNANGHLDSKGLETNAKISYKDFKLFLGYTFTDTKEHLNGIKNDFRLTPKHRINNVLMYEVEEKWKLGLEAYYFSKQKLSDGKTGKPYWLTGFLVEKIWDKFSLFINFENFGNTRQTKFDTIYTGSKTNPTFRDIYAPLDGFVVNGGLKLKL
ncbi:TonB-dependent receptor [Pedobacter sp. SD-b]|uniref:TonB-dependent receptor n=1 Tax=Pedobacter segetis TaxID=2793069 RepID=A0ABS1BNZ5_9SPHI|nr:TonB-dependent receptor [Pedobacter segetis]MBK0384507.1 TonB-dependent receptor [Pedobacter segetis]